MLNAFKWPHLISIAMLHAGYYYYPHFIFNKIETWRDKKIWPSHTSSRTSTGTQGVRIQYLNFILGRSSFIWWVRESLFYFTCTVNYCSFGGKGVPGLGRIPYETGQTEISQGKGCVRRNFIAHSLLEFAGQALCPQSPPAAAHPLPPPHTPSIRNSMGVSLGTARC